MLYSSVTLQKWCQVEGHFPPGALKWKREWETESLSAWQLQGKCAIWPATQMIEMMKLDST